jgi:dihydrodipicolinate synthase/N-acetylneuraminate lyase
MLTKKFSGVVVPMITPLNNDLSIDIAAVARIMNSFSNNDIHPLVLGTTGESSSIGEKDSLVCMEAVIAARSAHQLIYGGLVGNQVAALTERGNRYLEMGADAVVATLPSYYILNPDQMVAYYSRLADNLKGPLLMYNIKSTTQMTIPIEVVETLSKHPNIYGLKDSERDAERMNVCIERFSERTDFSYFCGWGAQSAGSLALGADGIVPSTGNIVPEWYKKLYFAASKGDFEPAIDLQTLTDEVAALYQKGRTLGESLAALKVLMNSVGLCGTTMMPPLTELSTQDAASICQQFADFQKK